MLRLMPRTDDDERQARAPGGPGRRAAGAREDQAEGVPVPVGGYDLATVYRLHAADVGRWAAGLLGPPYDVDDVVQEVFLVVQRRLPQWRPAAKLTTWLFEITRRVAMARRRRQRWLGWRSRPLDEAEPEPHPDGGPLESLERREAARVVYRLLDRLPEKYRVTLYLYEIEELSGPQVAELTGVTLENVWVRLHRARALFRKHFDAEQPSGVGQGHGGGGRR